MGKVAVKVLSTVNAPYGAGVTAHELATRIADPASAAAFHGPTFSFFSEVSQMNQEAFISEMGVDRKAAAKVARLMEKKAGYSLALAHQMS
jgi:hypothetical protein